MRYYIASKLENAENVRALKKILDAIGWHHTYDWTIHGSVRSEGAKRMQEVASDEIHGVATADICIVLLPGGRGTHVEIGIALAAGVKVALITQDGLDFGLTEHTCAFYHAEGVHRLIIGPSPIDMAFVAGVVIGWAS